MTRNQVWHQNSNNIKGIAEELDFFGFGLAATDFDNDGNDDLAISTFKESIGDIIDAGAVNIIYGSDDGLTATGNQLWHQDLPEIIGRAEDLDVFGAILNTGDYNNDGFGDIAIATPNESIGNTEFAGAVNIIYGSDDGLTATGNQLWHQDLPEIIGRAEDSDVFGGNLATGDFNNDDIDDLAISAPNESIGDIELAGAVNIVYGSDDGLTATDNQIWHQDSPEIIGRAEIKDSFGTVLTAGDFDGDGVDDLAISAPNESIGGIDEAGAVNIIYGSDDGLTATDNQIWHQGLENIIGRAEESDFFGQNLAAGDFNGDGKDDLVVATPDESIGDLGLAGAVNVIYGSASGLTATGNQIWHQNSPGIIGKAEIGDRFGQSLATGDFNGDGKDDLAVGSPFEAIGEVDSAGAVNVIYGSDDGLTATDNQIWHQGLEDILGEAEFGDGFGFSLSAGDFNGDGIDDLAISALGESVGNISGAGATHIIYGSNSGLAAS